MLVPAPYQAPEKKAKKKGKEARSGLRRKGTSDVASGDTEALSSREGDEYEEEEEEEKGDLYRPRGGGVQEGEDIPLGRLGFGCRSHPRVAP